MLRPFKRFGESSLKYLGQSTATEIRDIMKRVGICHYLIAFRPVGDKGDFTVFDFGPHGSGRDRDRDVTFNSREEGLVPIQVNGKATKAVQGEVREVKVSALSKDHLQLGTTQMTLKDVRELSKNLPQHYELHVNDCRHYVNSIAEATTGMERASLVTGRVSMKRESLLRFWSPWEMGMIITDYQHFPWVKQYSQTFATAMAAITGGKMGFNMLRPPINFSFLPAVPSLVKNGGKQLVQKPIRNSAITACATAFTTFNENSFFREGVRFTKDIAENIKAVAGVLEGATIGASASAINAIGSIGSVGSRALQPLGSPLEYFVSSVNSYATRATRASVSQVLRFTPTKRLMKVNALVEGASEKLSSATKEKPLSKVGVVFKHLPTLKMNKALQGRTLRLARPAYYQLAMSANVGHVGQ